MKKILIYLSVFVFVIVSFGCRNNSIKTEEEELSPFEITAIDREIAKNNVEGLVPLDAGRGNPNWINTKARLAFARLMEFAVSESERVFKQGDIAGQAKAEGMESRFYKCMNINEEIDKFLIDAIEYCNAEMGIDKTELLKELVDGIVGNYYPTPDRCLVNTEKILNKYLEKTIYDGSIVENTKIFPTEGGSAAMVYLFQSLNHNRVLKKGDKIAIATPIFTPYLEIPNVNQYGLVSIRLNMSADNDWDIADEEIKKLEDNQIKALFLVNPANPASFALSKETMQKIKKVIEKNPNLLIITDDVYGTFVNHFQTLYSVIPYNTILVYSFSKLYGVTGWRVGLVAMNENNVVDKIISNLPEKDKKFLTNEYSIVIGNDELLPFIERLTADSRSISLYHTSGLSTPQQVFMDILALTHLVYEGNDKFIEDINRIVNERYAEMMAALNLTPNENIENAKYYVIINFLDIVKNKFGEDFSKWLKEKYSDVEILDDMAKKKGVVLMHGPGFGADKYTYRISLANLEKEDYREIGNRLNDLINDYYDEYKKQEGTSNK